jgi:cell division protein FtsI/penicillin-binding protein 2
MAGKEQNQFNLRVYLLIALFLIWASAILVRLVNLQIFQYLELCEIAKRQRSRVFEISPKRGTIYDRQNRELAVSINVDSIYAVPLEIADKPSVAARLAAILQLDSQDLYRKLVTHRSFTWVKRKVDLPQATQVRNQGLAGIYFEKESKRFYPKRDLGAHVLGFVGMDNEGMNGLEFAYDKRIRGTPGKVLLMADAKQRSFSSVEKPPAAGEDLVLTIDEYIQYVVERELAVQVRESQALAGTAIVMDPNTGEILAMATIPTFNPNHYKEYSPDSYRNRAILSIYEPGSTFKIFTAATALEEHLATPDEQINCLNGSIVIGNRRIRDHKRYGILSVREVVAYSSNVGAIQLGFRIGKDRFERSIRNYGFGEPTAVDLPGEARGLLRPASQWLPINLGTISMGHGIGVTPIQLVTAVSAIANGGYLPRPHIVQRSRPGPVQQVSYEPSLVPRQVISYRTTQLIKEMLTGVVATGTGKAAQLEGFTSAGKTGTAQKLQPDGHYSHSKFIASFVGFAPIRNPAIAIVVTIDEPRGKYYGGEVAAPVFKKIAEKTLRYLSVLPDQTLTPRQIVQKRKSVGKDATEDADPDEIDLLDAEWGVAEASSQEQSYPVPSSEAVPLSADYQLAEGYVPGVDVPDFTGRSLRSVTYEAAKLGLQLNTVGSGIAVKQYPSPYTTVAPGSKISVKFSRHVN